MAHDDDETSPPANRGKRWFVAQVLSWVCLGLILVVHLLYLLSHFVPAIVHPDANGYWAQGSLLFTTGRTWFVPESDIQYTGIHWLVTESGRYFCRYPPGFPVLIGSVYALFGFKASVLVNPILATLSLLGLFFLIRRLLHPGWAVVGVLVMAINPIFNQQALTCISHMAVSFCLTWGLYFLLRWSERGRLWEIFLAGLLVGCIPTIRYPEALFALGVAIFLLLHVRTHKRIGVHYLVAIAGAALPIVPLLIRNHFAFGAFYRTGYALTNEQTGFGWDYFRNHFIGYVRNLHGDGAGLFFPLGVIGMVAMCSVRRFRRVGVLLLMVALPTTLLYMSYYWGSRWQSAGTMRFLMPTLVCYIIAGTWALSQMTERRSVLLKSCVIGTVILLQFVWGGFTGLDQSRRQDLQKESLVCVTDGLEKHVKHGDVVMANPQILQHLDFVRHWRLADPTILRSRSGRDRFMRADRDPDAPTPRQAEKQEIREEKYGGLAPDDREREVARDLREWADGHSVYYVGSAREVEQWEGPCFGRQDFKIIARVALPEPPSTPERERFVGRDGRRRPPGDMLPPPPGPGGPPMDRLEPRDRDRREMFLRLRDRMGRGMGGGIGRRGFPQGEKELVIAEWTYYPADAPRSASDQAVEE